MSGEFDVLAKVYRVTESGEMRWNGEFAWVPMGERGDGQDEVYVPVEGPKGMIVREVE